MIKLRTHLCNIGLGLLCLSFIKVAIKLLNFYSNYTFDYLVPIDIGGQKICPANSAYNASVNMCCTAKKVPKGASKTNCKTPFLLAGGGFVF